MKVCITLTIIIFVACLINRLSPAPSVASSPAAVTATTQTPDAPQLAVLAQQCRRISEHYMQCDGEVKNLTSSPIQYVKAFVSYYDKQQTFVTSDGALITFNPLMPGQQSPFKILTPYHPHLAQFSISFTTLWGHPITAQDQKATKQKPPQPASRAAKRS